MTGVRLTRHVKGFPELWLAQTVSLFGNQISLLALPTLAILSLQATGTQVGILRGLEWVFFPFLALWIGVLADRADVRPYLVFADVIRFLALIALVVGASADLLSMPLMFATAAIIGVGSVIFNVTFMAQIPRLIPAQLLGRANARMAIPQSVAEVTGPGVAALLIQGIGAVASLVVDALSYLVSALLIVRAPRWKAERSGPRNGILRDMAEGIGLIRQSRVLQTLSVSAALGNLAFGAVSTVLILFAYRQLQIDPLHYGVALSVGSLGAVLASLLAPRAHRLLGYAQSMTIGLAIFALAIFSLPLAALGPDPMAITAIVAAGWFGLSVGTPLFDIAQVTIRQAITPIRLQGRMNAAIRTAVFGALPLGAFAGGWAGDQFGYSVVLVAAGVCAALGCLATIDRSIRYLASETDLQMEARRLDAQLSLPNSTKG